MVIGSKTAYNEFLGYLNQFSQEYLDSKTLVEKVEPYLGRSPELFKWFKIFIKYKDEETICKYIIYSIIKVLIYIIY